MTVPKILPSCLLQGCLRTVVDNSECSEYQTLSRENPPLLAQSNWHPTWTDSQVNIRTGLQTLTGEVRCDEEERGAKKGKADTQGPLGLDLRHDACSYCGVLDLCREKNGGSGPARTQLHLGVLVCVLRHGNRKGWIRITKCTFA